MAVGPSVRQHRTTRLPKDGFCKRSIFEKFSKNLEKIHVWLKRKRITGTLDKENVHLYQYFVEFVLGKMFPKEFVKKLHFMFNIFFSDNRFVYEIKWEECGRARQKMC